MAMPLPILWSDMAVSPRAHFGLASSGDSNAAKATRVSERHASKSRPVMPSAVQPQDREEQEAPKPAQPKHAKTPLGHSSRARPPWLQTEESKASVIEADTTSVVSASEALQSSNTLPCKSQERNRGQQRWTNHGKCRTAKGSEGPGSKA